MGDVLRAGASRRRIARSLNEGYAGGLLSEDTFIARLDQLLGSRLVDPLSLVGDLNFRRGRRPGAAVRAITDRLLRTRLSDTHVDQPLGALLGLDWTGQTTELLIGRHEACDVVLAGNTVSRHHARLVFRDGKWIVHDLRSTNGTTVNGTSVARCELCPGDQLVLGEQHLTVD
jgi:hypothetical protein